LSTDQGSEDEVYQIIRYSGRLSWGIDELFYLVLPEVNILGNGNQSNCKGVTSTQLFPFFAQIYVAMPQKAQWKRC